MINQHRAQGNFWECTEGDILSRNSFCHIFFPSVSPGIVFPQWNITNQQATGQWMWLMADSKVSSFWLINLSISLNVFLWEGLKKYFLSFYPVVVTSQETGEVRCAEMCGGTQSLLSQTEELFLWRQSSQIGMRDEMSDERIWTYEFPYCFVKCFETRF